MKVRNGSWVQVMSPRAVQMKFRPAPSPGCEVTTFTEPRSAEKVTSGNWVVTTGPVVPTLPKPSKSISTATSELAWG